jgi:hypothetical protein
MKKIIVLMLLLIILESAYAIEQRTGQCKLIDIKNELWIKKGEYVNITAIFENMGETSVTAKFWVNIYKNNSLIGNSMSEAYVINAKTISNLSTIYEPKNSGQYIIKGYVIYDNKTTEVKESTLYVVDPNIIIPLSIDIVIMVLSLLPLFILVQMINSKFRINRTE